ncbi:macrophage mannose receptor 1-like [Trichoplusia ni]|uniref:Macrophage mannose receptor 1-like n=1 Tax=Trichoplusia ni TaxID=7111 RepID=A0A7E5W909_TRINI|nr:macrophage mannose receptor 1-like [Trichoplusia ni]
MCNMDDILKGCVLFLIFKLCLGSYHEQYRVPQVSSDRWESFIFNNKEYIVQNLPVNWENAKILCRGYHNGTLAIVDTRDKAEFLAEALSESQFMVTSVWVGARRDSAEDAAGYRWGQGLELRRTALDVLASEKDENIARHYPVWLNRTHVPVPETGADCVALERVNHDNPVFLDLPCHLERAFACERDAQAVTHVNKVNTVRCRGGLYHVYDGRMDWHQAAAYCVLRGMTLANISTLKCLRRLGMTMLKNRPSIENAWVGARGSLGRWTWIDTGFNVFQTPALSDATADTWPPMRDRANIKQNGCLQLDRHESHPPVFLEARCERKMQFICYEAVSTLKSTVTTPSDDLYYYVLVRQLYYWQHAYENCLKMNGTLASLDNNDILIQLLLVMGENQEEPIEHIWISGRLNMTKDVATDTVSYAWYNPLNTKRIPDPKGLADSSSAYMPPWLDEEFTMDNSCLNLDRQDHLIGLVYGLPCDTPQYSVCMIEKATKTTSSPAGLPVSVAVVSSTVETVSEGYETT